MDSFNAQFNARAAKYIAQTLGPQLGALFSRCPQIRVAVDPDDPQVVNVGYPASFSLEYLRPQVRLEIGPLASFVPRGSHTIQPYAAQSFHKVFTDPDCPVVAINAERTFWEKATILHQQAHRMNAMPSRYSRHYYDMSRLACSEVKQRALADPDLLKDVVAFKMRFYRCPWANYENAKPGTFRLVPDQVCLEELERDYRGMKVMIFGDVPRFAQIIDTLKTLEDEING